MPDSWIQDLSTISLSFYIQTYLVLFVVQAVQEVFSKINYYLYNQVGELININ